MRCPGFPKESMGWVACMWAAFSCLGAVSSQGLVLAKYAGPISVPCDPPHYLLVGGQGGSLESSENMVAVPATVGYKLRPCVRKANTPQDVKSITKVRVLDTVVT